MTDVDRVACLGLLACLMVTAGCKQFERRSSAYACTVTEDCVRGRVCSGGWCVEGDGDAGSLPCGDGTCAADETCLSCEFDCGLCDTCGDGTCDDGAGEDCSNCAADCGLCSSCGDGACDAAAGEDCGSCVTDCGVCATCGDAVCAAASGEDCTSCPDDCHACASCGNGECEAFMGEDCSSCPADCGACEGCGDQTCTQGFETCFSCPSDCGTCVPECNDGVDNDGDDTIDADDPECRNPADDDEAA